MTSMTGGLAGSDITGRMSESMTNSVTGLATYRDDGPIAALLGRVFAGGRRPAPAWVLTGLGALPLAAALASGTVTESLAGNQADSAADMALLGAATLWFVLLAGLAAGLPQRGRLSWLVPPALRVVEFGVLIRITALAEPSAMPACFAVLGIVAFHHYDAVYRLRHQRIAPPTWIRAIGGGWDGRLVAIYLLLVADALGAGFVIAAVALATIYLTESTLSWLRFSHAERPSLYEDEEDEDL